AAFPALHRGRDGDADAPLRLSDLEAHLPAGPALSRLRRSTTADEALRKGGKAAGATGACEPVGEPVPDPPAGPRIGPRPPAQPALWCHSLLRGPKALCR